MTFLRLILPLWLGLGVGTLVVFVGACQLWPELRPYGVGDWSMAVAVSLILWPVLLAVILTIEGDDE